MVSGRAISAQLRDMLYALVLQMAKLNQKKKSFSATEFEGVIRTTYQDVCVGALVGTLFQATVEGEGGRTDVRFVVDLPVASYAGEMMDPTGAEESRVWAGCAPRRRGSSNPLLN